MAEAWTGGCQCGAVRYVLTVRPDNACLCHCRMCQKQVGGPFAAWAGSHSDNFRLTRGSLAHFQSSADAKRGFCRDCGTPLTYEALSDGVDADQVLHQIMRRVRPPPAPLQAHARVATES